MKRHIVTKNTKKSQFISPQFLNKKCASSLLSCNEWADWFYERGAPFTFIFGLFPFIHLNLTYSRWRRLSAGAMMVVAQHLPTESETVKNECYSNDKDKSDKPDVPVDKP